jgi:hypothetical protein
MTDDMKMGHALINDAKLKLKDWCIAENNP